MTKAETAVMARALTARRMDSTSESAGEAAEVAVNSYVTDQDRRIRIPENSEEELERMTRQLELTELEQRRVKGLLEAFSRAKVILERYREPVLSQKRYELQRQFRLSMHTALPKGKEAAADEYLERMP